MTVSGKSEAVLTNGQGFPLYYQSVFRGRWETAANGGQVTYKGHPLYR